MSSYPGTNYVDQDTNSLPTSAPQLFQQKLLDVSDTQICPLVR